MNMKKEISPPVAIGIIVVIVLILVLSYGWTSGWFQRGTRAAQEAGAGPPMYPGVVPGESSRPVAPMQPMPQAPGR